jgi:hypothetical protein
MPEAREGDISEGSKNAPSNSSHSPPSVDHPPAPPQKGTHRTPEDSVENSRTHSVENAFYNARRVARTEIEKCRLPVLMLVCVLVFVCVCVLVFVFCVCVCALCVCVC